MWQSMNTLLYDGTMAGLLTCIFEVYAQHFEQAVLQTEISFQQDAFSESILISADAIKAKRVWNGLGKKLSNEARSKLYHAFLSNLPGVENLILEYVRYAFKSEASMEQDFGNAAVLEINQIARKVGREKHRMEAFVRFQLLKNGWYYASVEPDFNVLPIIVPHFRSRYSSMDWVIYDLRRRYGIHHTAATGLVQEVEMEWEEGANRGDLSPIHFDPSEEHYKQLWKNYFKSTGIAARNNPSLHLRHIPARYWRHLTEKK